MVKEQRDMAEMALRVTSKSQHGQPQQTSSNFNCPHCTAYTQQFWGGVYAVTTLSELGGQFSRGVGPEIITLAQCSGCNKQSVFVDGVLVFPETLPLRPVADMPEDVAADFNEAAGIFARSPRGAAALLRLAIQKLLPHLGSGKNDINAGIGELVERGTIPIPVQQALDSVRVIGNEAVHPGQIDLRDNPQMARSLFDLANFIVERGISEPKRIAEIFGSLPETKLAQIEKRDGQPKGS